MRHKISKVTPLSLVSPSRLDVFCRLEFVRDEITKVGRSWGKQLYKEFICKSSLDKNGLEAWGEDGVKWSYPDYEDSFKSLVYSIQENGYDDANHPIPVSESIPTNGAHRLAIALSLDLIDISVTESLETPPNYNYNFLSDINMSDFSIDFVALDYIRTVKTSGFFLFFGINKKDTVRLLRKVFPDSKSVILVKNIQLTEVGKRKIVQSCYAHNEWWKDNLLEQMVGERFGINSRQATAVFYDTRFLWDSEANIKGNLRGELGKGEFLRKIHGSDSDQESRDLAELLLSQVGRTFINFASINSGNRVLSHLEKVGFSRDLFNANSRELVITGSIVHQLFGNGQARDIDCYLSNHSEISKANFKGVDLHNSFYSLVGINGEEILSRPNLHFYFKGHLFANPNYVSFIRSTSSEEYVAYSHQKNDSNLEKDEVETLLRRKAISQRLLFHIRQTKSYLYSVAPKGLRRTYKTVKNRYLSKRNF